MSPGRQNYSLTLRTTEKSYPHGETIAVTLAFG
jgi:hypothetical protein